MQAAKAQFERDLAGKEDSVEEGRRQLIKQVRPTLDGRLSALPSFDPRDGRRSTESRQLKTLLKKDLRSHYTDVKRRHRIDFRQSTFCRLSSKTREGKAESRPSKLDLSEKNTLKTPYYK